MISIVNYMEIQSRPHYYHPSYSIQGCISVRITYTSTYDDLENVEPISSQ